MKSLSSTQIKQYQDKGFVAPIEALSQNEANEVKDEIEFIEKFSAKINIRTAQTIRR